MIGDIGDRYSEQPERVKPAQAKPEVKPDDTARVADPPKTHVADDGMAFFAGVTIFMLLLAAGGPGVALPALAAYVCLAMFGAV